MLLFCILLINGIFGNINKICFFVIAHILLNAIFLIWGCFLILCYEINIYFPLYIQKIIAILFYNIFWENISRIFLVKYLDAL